MNLFQLFTPAGLTRAMKAHHKYLHNRYNFPPLNGEKPVHKLAEQFGEHSAEPFVAQLRGWYDHLLCTTLSLSNGNTPGLVHIEVHEESDAEGTRYQLRVQREGEAALLICDVDMALTGPIAVRYLSEGGVDVYTGAYALNLVIEGNTLSACLFERTDKQAFSPAHAPQFAETVTVIDKHEEDWVNDEDDYGFRIPVSVEDALSSLHLIADQDEHLLSGTPYSPMRWDENLHEVLLLRKDDAQTLLRAPNDKLPRFRSNGRKITPSQLSVHRLKDYRPSLHFLLALLAGPLNRSEMLDAVRDRFSELDYATSPVTGLYWAKEDWHNEVQQKETVLTYEDWLCHQVESWAHDNQVNGI